ncbi:MAG: helix-turn-helix transcriptional regulator [Eubacteriales bacterium]|nr:helix-turn-helix transcriptional regulator [Eubacteriales bacterium]
MSIVFDAIQFIETSLLFSAFLFSAIMFIRTRDSLAGRTLIVLFPVATILFISYMYGINARASGINDSNMAWLSPLFALLVIALIMAAILATCYYVLQLFPVSHKKKRIGFISCMVLVGILLIITAILVMYMSKSDLTRAITNALWAFYPLCSMALFIEAVALSCVYKNIKDTHDQKLAGYFLIAFIPQIMFSVIDFFLLRVISFQLTHLSYTVFSLFVFIDLSTYFFKYYNRDLDISKDKLALKDKFMLSDREIEVTELLARGMTNQIIGERLYISINTVKSHIKSIYKKLGISNRLQLINLLSGLSSRNHL